MILLPQTVLEILAHGGSVRLSAKQWMPTTMEQYAAMAKQGGGHVTFVVGDAILMPQIMCNVSAMGSGAVTFDFVSKDGSEE
jgi:hypothetical protein